MSSTSDPSPTARPRGTDAPGSGLDRRAALRRLAGVVVGLGTLAGVFAVGGVVGTETVRAQVAPLGAWGPIAYVPAAAVLGTLLVPGAALSAAAGLLFGPWVGFVCAVAAAVSGALLSRSVSRRAGAAAFDVAARERVVAVAELARSNGLLAVVVARLLPVLPDGPMNHAFGVVRLRRRDLALGTVLAASPRALSYALLGSSADDLTGTAALAGIALNLGTGAVGLLLGLVLVHRWRRTRPARAGTAVPSAGAPGGADDPTGTGRAPA